MCSFFSATSCSPLLLTMLKSILDRRQRCLKTRDGLAHGDFPDDGSLHASQTRLLRCLDLDQIKAGFVRIVDWEHADREVERGLEVMTRIELLFGNHIRRLVGSGSL